MSLSEHEDWSAYAAQIFKHGHTYDVAYIRVIPDLFDSQSSSHLAKGSIDCPIFCLQAYLSKLVFEW